MYEFGRDAVFRQGWHVSAGYVFSENSVPDAHYSPLAADMDRHFFSVGVGHRCRQLSWDVAYQFGWGPAHTVSGSSPSSSPALFSGQRADGKYDFISHAVLVTVGLHFRSRGRLAVLAPAAEAVWPGRHPASQDVQEGRAEPVVDVHIGQERKHGVSSWAPEPAGDGGIGIEAP